jgi:hypothetical protein
MIRKGLAPHFMQCERRFPKKIMLTQELKARWRFIRITSRSNWPTVTARDLGRLELVRLELVRADAPMTGSADRARIPSK